MSTTEPQIYIRQWREARGFSQQQLADAIGRDKSIVSKLERGVSGLTTATLNGIAAALGIGPGQLYEPPAQTAGRSQPLSSPYRDSTTPLQRTTSDNLTHLPVYASAQGGKTGMLLSYDPIDWIRRPEPLTNVKDGFAMYVVGDSMEPAYYQGDIILVHPRRPPNPGSDVLVIKKGDSEEYEALIKKLVATNDNQIRLLQHNPEEEFTLDKSDVDALYFIIGKYNR